MMIIPASAITPKELFMDFISLLMSYAPTALAVLGAVIGVLVVVSPLTKSDVDNRMLDALRKLADMLGRLIGAAGPKAK